MPHSTQTQVNTAPWNSRRRIGPKPPLKLREIWAIRIRLQLAKRTRDLALFNLAIDSKLRGCDLVRLRVGDIAHSGCVVARATVMQRKTQQPAIGSLDSISETPQLEEGHFVMGDRLPRKLAAARLPLTNATNTTCRR